MHELSIARQLVRMIRQQLNHTGTTHQRVLTIRLTMGPFSCIHPEALGRAYRALTHQTPLANASLQIHKLPYRGVCGRCDVVSTLSDPFSVCPHCGSSQIHLEHHEALQIESIEVADIDPASRGASRFACE